MIRTMPHGRRPRVLLALGLALFVGALSALALTTAPLWAAPGAPDCSCACAKKGTGPSASPTVPLSSMPVSKLREAFNAQSDKVRVVTLLSPTCPFCVRGHEHMQTWFDALDNDALAGIIVWEPITSKDSQEAAESQASTWQDPRVIEGWDGGREAGDAFRETLGLKYVAWDVYLIYDKGVRWEAGQRPPQPTFWMHQLGRDPKANPDQNLDPKRFLGQLRAQLNETR